MYENQHTPSGTEVDTDESVDGCKTACLRDVACVAVDYRRSDGLCWKHTGTTSTSIVFDGSDQYILTDRYIGEQISSIINKVLKIINEINITCVRMRVRKNTRFLCKKKFPSTR